MCVYSFITLVSCFVYFWRAGSVRISLAGRVIYFLCGTPLCGVPGRYNFIRALSWGGWRDCSDFFLLWLCCSGYDTVELVKGGRSVFLFAFFCLLHFFWRLDVCGRNFVLYNLIYFGRIVVFLAVPYFVSC